MKLLVIAFVITFWNIAFGYFTKNTCYNSILQFKQWLIVTTAMMCA